MNKWKEVANIFDLELGEEFYLSGGYTDKYVFTEEGLMFYGGNGELIEEGIDEIVDLLNGDCEVEKAPWKPKISERYWFLESYDGGTRCDLWNGFTTDYGKWKIGNCFKTKEEAETKGKEVMEQIKKEYEDA